MARDTNYWRRSGEAARAAHAAVTQAFRARLHHTRPADYQALLTEMHAKTNAALPESDPQFLRRLAKGDARAVDEAIAFLEADPWFFRSGYQKERLIRHLKRLPLRGGQRARLGEIVIAAIDGRDRREFRHYCRLACAVWSTHLDDRVALRIASDDAGIRRRAIWVGEAAIAAGKA